MFSGPGQATLYREIRIAGFVWHTLNHECFHHMPWEVIFFGMIKLIKAFRLIPGAIAAFAYEALSEMAPFQAMSGCL